MAKILFPKWEFFYSLCKGKSEPGEILHLQTGTVFSCRVAVADVLCLGLVPLPQCFLHFWFSIVCFPSLIHTSDLLRAYIMLKIPFPHLFIFCLPFHLPSMLSPLPHPTRCEAKENRDCFFPALPPDLIMPGRWKSSWEAVPRHRAGLGLMRANRMLV